MNQWNTQRYPSMCSPTPNLTHPVTSRVGRLEIHTAAADPGLRQKINRPPWWSGAQQSVKLIGACAVKLVERPRSKKNKTTHVCSGTSLKVIQTRQCMFRAMVQVTQRVLHNESFTTSTRETFNQKMYLFNVVGEEDSAPVAGSRKKSRGIRTLNGLSNCTSSLYRQRILTPTQWCETWRLRWWVGRHGWHRCCGQWTNLGGEGKWRLSGIGVVVLGWTVARNVRLVFAECSLDVRLVFAWYSLGIHLVFTWYSLDIHLVLIFA
jgi:hypothetical protein